MKVEIKNLKVSFHHQKVFNQFSLNLETEGITSILGRSGTGKSVLLKSIVGLLIPDSGTIWIDGKELKQLEISEVRQKILYVPQLPALFDHLNLIDNILFPQLLLKRKVLDSEAIGWLRSFGVAEKLHFKKPSELSLGIQKLASLIRAVLLNPKLLLLDEPSTGLGPREADLLFQAILRVAKDGIPSVLVTHDIQHSLKFSQRIVLLDKGEIVFDGGVQEFRASKNTLVVEYNENF